MSASAKPSKKRRNSQRPSSSQQPTSSGSSTPTSSQQQQTPSGRPTPAEKKSADQRDWDSLSSKERKDKVNNIIRYLLCASSKRIPVKRDDVVKAVMQGKRCFNVALQAAKQKLEKEFGMTVVEGIRGSQKVLIIINNLSEESRQMILKNSDDTLANYGLLSTILSFLLLRPNQTVDEEQLWSLLLNPLGVHDDSSPHPQFGNVKSTLDTFIEQCYLEKKKKVVGEVSSWEYSWGVRAQVEVDKKELLKAMSEVYDGEPFDVWEKQYGDLISS